MNHFRYDELNDTYTCPQQQVLITNGNWYKKSKDSNHYVVKHYKPMPAKFVLQERYVLKTRKEE
jgi:hypothetical protein